MLLKHFVENYKSSSFNKENYFVAGADPIKWRQIHAFYIM